MSASEAAKKRWAGEAEAATTKRVARELRRSMAEDGVGISVGSAKRAVEQLARKPESFVEAAAPKHNPRCSCAVCKFERAKKVT